MHAAVIEGANDKEDNNEEELESLGDEDGEEDNLGLGDDFSDPDFDPEEESVSDDSVSEVMLLSWLFIDGCLLRGKCAKLLWMFLIQSSDYQET